ncbi:MAG: flagellar biosynthesis anti-sigma factor FlgM [Clostridium sp.]|nr:flagellar biosynthesis anti-sigma factor FlgM [Clostridium sp.]
MKIWDSIPKVVGTYDKQKRLTETAKGSVATPKKDVVSISSRAKDIQTAVKALKDIPDVRTDKVEALSREIDNGTYSVDTADIADKILKSIAHKRI